LFINECFEKLLFLIGLLPSYRFALSGLKKVTFCVLKNPNIFGVLNISEVDLMNLFCFLINTGDFKKVRIYLKFIFVVPFLEQSHVNTGSFGFELVKIA